MKFGNKSVQKIPKSHIQNMVGVVTSRQPAERGNPPTYEPPIIKAQAQQETPHKLNKGQPYSIQIRSKRLDHWVPQKCYHRSPPHEDRQTKQNNLRRRNEQKEPPKMGRQKNPQSKGKEESADKELDEIRASNLSDTEFKIMVIRMLRELIENYKELSGN